MRSIIIGLTMCMGTATAATAQDAKVARGAQVYADQKCAV